MSPKFEKQPNAYGGKRSVKHAPKREARKSPSGEPKKRVPKYLRPVPSTEFRCNPAPTKPWEL